MMGQIGARVKQHGAVVVLETVFDHFAQPG